MTFLTLGTISSLTRISVWLIELLAKDEFVMPVTTDGVTKHMATKKIFVISISEETNEKGNNLLNYCKVFDF